MALFINHKFDNRHKLTKDQKRGNRLFWIIGNVFILPISWYVAGIFSQLVLGYGMFVPMTEDPKSEIVYTVPEVLHFWSGHFLIALAAWIILVILLNMFAYRLKLAFTAGGVDDADRNFRYADEDVYGTSRWMNDEEKVKILNTYTDTKDTNEMILGRDLKNPEVIMTLPDDSKLNRHKMVMGGSGSGKSAAVVRNDVFQLVKKGESMVFTDPSGELFESMGVYLKKNGYNVKVFNLVQLEHSDSWNCLAEIGGSDINAQIFADTIIKNTGGDKNDDFWSKCAMNLLKALCLYVERSPILPTNMGEVYKLLTTRNTVELDQLFDDLNMNSENEAAKMAYNVFKNASDNVKGGVLIDLGSRLQVFQSAVVRKITSYEEFNFKRLGDEKTAYFVITSDQHPAFDFLAVLFYSMLFIKLVDHAHEQQDGRLPIPVNFILDEFSNIGAIPDFTKKISTVRKYGINITVIIQNIAQIQNRYPKGQWEEIIGNCNTFVFLGCDDSTTANYISDNTGIATVVVNSKSHDRTAMTGLKSLDYKESSGLGKRAIMTPDEVKQMPADEAILFIHGQKPLKVKKFFYWEHPESKNLEPCKITNYTPNWQVEEKREELFTSKKEDEKRGTLQEQYEEQKKAERNHSLKSMVKSRNKPNAFR